MVRWLTLAAVLGLAACDWDEEPEPGEIVEDDVIGDEDAEIDRPLPAPREEGLWIEDGDPAPIPWDGMEVQDLGEGPFGRDRGEEPLEER